MGIKFPILKQHTKGLPRTVLGLVIPQNSTLLSNADQIVQDKQNLKFQYLILPSKNFYLYSSAIGKGQKSKLSNLKAVLCKDEDKMLLAVKSLITQNIYSFYIQFRSKDLPKTIK